jgi:hypothetical protein
MYALNYLHIGKSKTWYIVPSEYKEKFEEVIQSKYHDVFSDNPNILHHITMMISPVELARN